MINDISPEDKKFLDLYLKDKPYLFVAFIDEYYLEFGYNWFENLKKFKHENNILFICLDQGSLKALKNKNIASIFLNALTYKESDLNYFNNTQDYNDSFKKTFVVASLIKNYKVDVILSHMDIVFLKDPMEKIKELFQSYDILFSDNKNYMSDILTRSKKDIINDSKYGYLDFKTVLKDKQEGSSTDFELIFLKNNDRVNLFFDLLKTEITKNLKENKIENVGDWNTVWKDLHTSNPQLVPISEFEKNDTKQLKNVIKYSEDMKRNQWDWDKSGPILGTVWQGKYEIVDGAHRIEAAKMAGIKLIPFKDVGHIINFNKHLIEKLLNECNVKITYLNHMLFLNGYVLKYKNINKDILNKFLEKAYTLHYFTLVLETVQDEVDYLDHENRRNKRIEIMKENNHWFL